MHGLNTVQRMQCKARAHLTKADLPTLAAPMTYTSRPLRSMRSAFTTSATPWPAAPLAASIFVVGGCFHHCRGLLDTPHP